jgi:pilus assembly protein Flp/PilA
LVPASLALNLEPTVETLERRMTTLLSRLWQGSSGATAVEYALMAGLIAVVIVAAVSALGVNLLDLFTNGLDEVWDG